MMKVVNRAKIVEIYDASLSHKLAMAVEAPTLEQTISKLEGTPEAPAFDAKTDKALEDYAKKVLEERRANHGR